MESGGNGELVEQPLTHRESEFESEPDLAVRLSEFESVGRRLWPFVRYFGLFGGDSHAIEAAADLGRLLGHSGQPADIDTITRRAKVQAFEELACWLEHSPWLRRMAPDARKPFVEAVRELAASS